VILENNLEMAERMVCAIMEEFSLAQGLNWA